MLSTVFIIQFFRYLKAKKWPKLSEFLFLEFWNFIKKIRIKNIAKKICKKKKKIINWLRGTVQ